MRVGDDVGMVVWEYLIVALPPFEAPHQLQGESPAVAALNQEGGNGWEAVTMMPLGNGSVAVLMKRPKR